MHKSFLLILIIVSVSLMSCDKKRVFDEYQSIPNKWNKDSIITFNLQNIDSIENYNLFINVRNNSDFAFSNLFLIAQIQFPEGKVITDTLEYQMATPNGQWLGTGFGSIKENKLWYKENFGFNEAGEFKVSIQQAMRKNRSEQGIENLEGVTQVGFRIEKTQN